MNTLALLLIAVFLALLSCLHRVIDKKRRESLFGNFGIRGRARSHAKTPPRSLSPLKATTETSTAAPDYTRVFPPSRSGNAATSEIAEKDASSGRWEAPVPFDTTLEQLQGHEMTPTGFSVDEIRRLGDFPDYARLSGVPLPECYANFDIHKALPRPYRPFRWSYHQTMSLLKLEPNWWLELESSYIDRIRQRKELYAKHGEAVLQWLPGSEIACKELMEMCVQFLCARYPEHFVLDEQLGVLSNKILKTEIEIKSMHPLLVLLENVPEDFAIMLRNPEDGLYYFRAGVICSALGWNVASKIGKKLSDIHSPVPDYKEKMEFSMDRYFAKKPTDRPIQRGSWGLEVDEPLYMPPGDPHEKLREEQSSDLTLPRCNLRVDWQTLRRLPLSGAIVFNFKAVFTPVAKFREEPFIPALVLRNLNQAKANIMAYKNTWHTEHVVKPALEEMVRYQEAQGWVPENWEPETLAESPWYPGWQERWKREQNFG